MYTTFDIVSLCIAKVDKWPEYRYYVMCRCTIKLVSQMGGKRSQPQSSTTNLPLVSHHSLFYILCSMKDYVFC